MEQLSLLNPNATTQKIRRRVYFEGPPDEPTRTSRLACQLGRISKFMADGEWRTLSEIADHTGDPPASVSAQLRHLRKDRFGGHTVEKRHIEDGLWQYRVLFRQPGDAP